EASQRVDGVAAEAARGKVERDDPPGRRIDDGAGLAAVDIGVVRREAHDDAVAARLAAGGGPFIGGDHDLALAWMRSEYPRRVGRAGGAIDRRRRAAGKQ